MNRTKVVDLLKKHTQQRLHPDGTPYASLLDSDEKEIAEKTSWSRKRIQITALENSILPERYCRNHSSLNSREQILLLQSHVTIVGQGGLGGAVTEILARIGIGRLTLVDGDVFEDSNLNRQLLSDVKHLGHPKAEVAKLRVESINPAIEVTSVNSFFTQENGKKILEESNIAVDCLDSIPSRFVLEEACRRRGIPLVSAAIGGSSGQATVIFPKDVGLRRIYGDPEKAAQKGIETRLGTLPYTAIFMAALECAEVVAVLCQKTSSLQDRILITNIADKSMDVISFT
ncbi:MAG: HesA/MoeB/ThiF family protein [Desulfocapsaceae bacterium]|nr:HesA/MoeB/ThiF family protein [Desulfocapsaceae bacterium]